MKNSNPLNQALQKTRFLKIIETPADQSPHNHRIGSNSTGRLQAVFLKQIIFSFSNLHLYLPAEAQNLNFNLKGGAEIVFERNFLFGGLGQGGRNLNAGNTSLLISLETSRSAQQQHAQLRFCMLMLMYFFRIISKIIFLLIFDPGHQYFTKNEIVNSISALQR